VLNTNAPEYTMVLRAIRGWGPKIACGFYRYRFRGYCMMIGGEDVVKYLDSIFVILAPDFASASRTPGRKSIGGTAQQGYLHCGPNDAGHFVKMVHNGIEYGLMAAYAEGLSVLRSANVGRIESSIEAEGTPLRDPEHYQ
jgi:6-phosphogluconate dehydrogenase